MEEILLLDIISFLFLNNLGSDEFDWFWLFITDKRQTIFFFLIVTTLLFRKFNWRKIIFLYLTIAILITMSDQTSNWFKDYFLRLRPCHEESIKSLLRLVKSSCGGKYGFFSAHASNTFALSIFLIIPQFFDYKKKGEIIKQYLAKNYFLEIEDINNIKYKPFCFIQSNIFRGSLSFGCIVWFWCLFFLRIFNIRDIKKIIF